MGYLNNHFSFTVRDLNASLTFYNCVLGFRTLMTLQATPHFHVAYLGHAHGGRNGTGYQTAAEMLREKNNAGGMIELMYFDVGKMDLPSSSDKTNTFAHLGIVVPDIQATQKRLDGMKVEVLKRYGDDAPNTGKLANSQGLNPDVQKKLGDEFKAVHAAINGISKHFIYVVDPDGNVIEIQPQDE